MFRTILCGKGRLSMRVLLEYLGVKEAGPILTYGMAKGFLENGIDVYMILSEEIENKNLWTSTFPKEKLFFLKTTPKKSRLIPTSLSFLKDCLSIKRKFHKKSFDLVITTFLVLSGWDRTICNLVKSKRRFTIIHDPIPHSSMPISEAKKYKKLVAQSKEIVVLTKKFIPVIETEYSYPKEKIHYMRLGRMTFTDYSNQNEDNSIRSIRFLFFGRIDGYKGINILLNAYELVSRDLGNSVELCIAGNGDFSIYQDKYSTLTNASLINRYIDDDEIPKIFSKPGTVLVLPYIDATQSGVTPLAFQFSVPVIASDTGGLKEQLFDGEVGSYFKVGDCEQLYKEMKKYADNHELYKQEQNKMNKYAHKLDWSVIIYEFLNHLRG